MAYDDYLDPEERRNAQLDRLGYGGDPYAEKAPAETPFVSDQNTENTKNPGFETTNIIPATETPTTPTATAAPAQPAFQPAQPMAFAAPSGGGGGGTGGTEIADATPAKAPVITDEVTALLRQRLKDLGQPMDILGDPIYQNQLKAFNVQSQRDADRTRAAEAQRRAVSGTGGLSTAVRGINEAQGERNQAFGANLAAQRFQQREAQLNQAIQMARAVGQDDVAMQLENEKLKLAVEALRVQQGLGMADIGLRRELGLGQLGLGQQQLGLGYDQLGFNYANLQNSMNRDAVLAALGGPS